MEVWGGNDAGTRGVVVPGLDIWVLSRPLGTAGASDDDAELSRASGGDVHYLSSCATGRVTRALLADVSGHGESVGSEAASLRLLMRRYVNYSDMRRFVGELNREFLRLSRLGMFATAIALTYWSPTRSLVMCNAGHPRALRYRARTRSWTPVRGTRSDAAGDAAADLPLGILDAVEYTQAEVTLAPGDMVLLYTDGLIESRPEGGKPWGEAGLIEQLGRLDAGDPQGLVQSLFARLRGHAAGRIDDDLTLMLLRPNELGIRRSLSERMTAVTAAIKGTMAHLTGSKSEPLMEWSFVNVFGFLIPAVNRIKRARARASEE